MEKEGIRWSALHVMSFPRYPQVALGVQEQLLQLFTMKGRRVIVLAGPTGIGKTALSLELAQMLGGRSSPQMPSKCTEEWTLGRQKSQRLIAIAFLTTSSISVMSQSPSMSMTFVRRAKAAFEDIIARKSVPIIVGGTGFYIHSLIYGPPSGPPSDPTVRKKLEEEMDRLRQ